MTHVTKIAGGSSSLTAPLTPTKFTTVGLPEDERIELWEGHNAEALIGLRCRTLNSLQLEATETNLHVGSLNLARVVGTPHVVERDSELIRRRPSDAVAMFICLAGEAFFSSDNGVRAIRPGQMLLCDADKAFMRGFSRGLEELVVKIPRYVFTEVTGEPPGGPVVFDFSGRANVHATALAQHICQAMRSLDPIPPDERAILELISVLTSGRRRGDMNVAYRAAARSYIASQVADPTLSAPRIADAIGISTRQLSRVFAADHTSVPQYILRCRLERAHTLLERTVANSLTIAEVAQLSGFTSAAHFSNAFTSHFGRRPSDVRREAVVARSISAS